MQRQREVCSLLRILSSGALLPRSPRAVDCYVNWAERGAITRFAVIKRIGGRRRLEWQTTRGQTARVPDLKLDLDARGVKPKIARLRSGWQFQLCSIKC